MEVLVLDGKNYIKASKAAKELGYTSDYVGQLCRSGKVNAHLIGRSWYVDQEALGVHKNEKKRMSRVKAREQAKQAIAEHRDRVNKKNPNYEKLAITYESDDSVLIPEMRNLTINSEVPKQPKKRGRKPKLAQETGNIVENEGEKIIMQGDLDIIDVTDGVPDPHTTFLESTIVAVEDAPTKKAIKKKDKITEKTSENNTISDKASSFEDKLASLEIADTEPSVTNNEIEVHEDHTLDTVEVGGRKVSIWPYTLTVSAIILLTILTLPTKLVVTYSATETDSVSETLSYDIENFLASVRNSK